MKTFAILSTLLVLALPAVAAPQPYALQKEDSSVGFSWSLGQDEVRGSMPIADADIVLDLDRLQNSTATVVVDVRGARAGFPFASQGMKSKKVLWAQKYPTITFQSTRFQRDGDRAIVDGTLTVRGVSRPARFTAELFRPKGTAADDVSRLLVQLTGSLSRAEFEADGWSDLAGDEVRLSIKAKMRIGG
ncbi:YceI family protein [Actibacterium ureilyticum]|uniref:YceI family protein n=1 Tax=Actibacterium ureilyticum TaxID=1590614 RepID=UPI001595F15A|nr:YceI family protein [Actibacterium ureilyticum]